MAEIHNLIGLAVLEDDVTALQQFIINNLNVINAQDFGQNTPLHNAVAFGDKGIEVVKLLLQNGAEVDIRNAEQRTPLHDACKTNVNLEVVKLLLDKGSEVIAVDSEGKEPLHHVLSDGASSEARNVAELLISVGGGVNKADAEGKTPLHYAASSGDEKSVAMLLRNGADIHARDAKGKTPLHYAAGSGYEDEVELLLENGADIHARDAEGKTPLHLAASSGEEESVAMLLDNGAGIDVRDAEGKTPLHLAVMNNKAKMVKQLVKVGGADLRVIDKATDPQNYTKLYELLVSTQPKWVPKQVHSLPEHFKRLPSELLGLGGVLSASSQPGYDTKAEQRDKDAAMFESLKNNSRTFDDVLKHMANDPVIAELKAVHDAGITKIYSFAHENNERNPELLKRLFEGMFPGSQYITKIGDIEIAMEDWRDPKVEQLNCIASNVIEDLKASQNVLIHCGYGEGRTGMVLAAIWMEATKNYDVAQAIHVVRKHYLSGAIETPRQCDVLRGFANIHSVDLKQVVHQLALNLDAQSSSALSNHKEQSQGLQTSRR